ncbi:MAG: argininosuccinate lyase [Methanocorpusculum sp.]|nr:argininosuccinate lyase [Methanocorpusculum sp.]
MAKDQIRKGRLDDERPAEVEAFLSSMDADREIAECDIRVDMAHILMLHEQNLIDTGSAKKLLQSLLRYMNEGLPEDAFNPAHEDIHAGIEAQLIKDAGSDAGGRMHLGRSRNDEVATCLRMKTREYILQILSGLFDLRRALIERAEESVEVIMPGFTHLQHAQPTTLAHYLMSYENLFTRDADRLFAAYARVNRSPLGSAAFAGTGFPLDRERTALLLGFSGPMDNSMDGVANRDFILETISAFAILMTNISRMAEELIFWSSALVRFVTLDDAFCSTSSIMPQKKNPDTLEVMRAKAAYVSGELTAALTLIKGLPMSYNRDLQDLNPHLWRAAHETAASVPLLAQIIRTTVFDESAMKKSAKAGNTGATELADSFVREFNLPFRTAHNIVGRAVKLGSFDLAVIDEISEEFAGCKLSEKGLTQEFIDKVQNPKEIVKAKKTTGSPNPRLMKKAIQEADVRLVQDEVTGDILRDELDSADEKMKEAIGMLS